MNRSLRGMALAVIALLVFQPDTGQSAAAKITSNEVLHASTFERRIQLSLNGETLSLLLQPSYVTASVTTLGEQGDLLGGPQIRTYTGIVEGDAQSWVRLTLGQSAIRGVVSHYGQRYEVDTTDSGDITVEPLTATDRQFVTKNTNGGVLRRQNLSLTDDQNLTAKGVTRVAKIAIVVDSRYNDNYNGKGVEKALSIINSVDGIYREEFGLALEVRTIISYTDASSDPLIYGPVPIETMLRDFREYRIHNNNLQDVSMVHLFTGNENSDEPVGLAWIDTACRDDGYDVGISTDYHHDILLAAHEIAHNLGAHHDTETACAAETNRLMWPYISSQTSQQFSRCTHEAIQLSLESSCHAPAIDLQLDLVALDINILNIRVINNDPVQTNHSAKVTFDLPPGVITTALKGVCTYLKDQIQCLVGTLLPGAERNIVLDLQPNDEAVATASQVLNASLELNGAIDVVSENNRSAAELIYGRLDMTAAVNPDISEAAPPRGGNSGTGAILPVWLFALLVGVWAIRRRVRF